MIVNGFSEEFDVILYSYGRKMVTIFCLGSWHEVSELKDVGIEKQRLKGAVQACL